MKRVIILAAVIILALSISPGQETDKKIEEYVDVVHAEILLRAIRDGKTVGGLTEKDLTLYENGKKVKITSMVEIKRKMKIQKLGLETQEEMIRKPRFFILYFWITSPRNNVSEALDYFFSDVFQQEDQVILAVRDQAFRINDSEDIAAVRKDFQSYIDGITADMTEDIKALSRRLETMSQEIRTLIFRLESGDTRPEVIEELSHKKMELVLEAKYVSKHFKYKYFTMNDKKLRDLSESIKGINLEKWGIMFFQPPTYPFVDVNNYYIKKILSMFSTSENPGSSHSGDSEGVSGGEDSILGMDREELMLEMGKPQNLLGIRKIRQAFFEADATFHMVQLDADTVTESSQEFVKRYHLGNKWETAFKEIVKVTGGNVQRGNNLLEAMNKIAEREDIHYILTYLPGKTDNPKRRLTFKSREKGIKLYHHKRINININREITVEKITYRFPVLGFKLSGFRMKWEENRLLGRVRLRVTAVDSENRMENFEREFALNLEEVDVSFTLHLVHGEKYEIIVDVLDMNTRKRRVARSHIEVPQNPPGL